MPEYAIARDHVRAALTVDRIGDAIVVLARGGTIPIGVTEGPRTRLVDGSVARNRRASGGP